MYYYPAYKNDGGLLHSHFSWNKYLDDKTLVQELKDRGYDITTLRFSIMKNPNHPRWQKP